MTNLSNPYQAPKVGQPRKNPPEGMLGLIATEDGWAEIDSNGHIRKILTKDEFDAYKRAEISQINAELDKKVDMTDGSNLLFSAVDSIKDLTWITSAGFNGDALYTTDWDGVECREDPIGEYDDDKKTLEFPVEMVFEKPEDYLKIPIEPLTLTKGTYNKNLYFLSLPTDGIHVDEITPVVDFECHLGDYVFIYSDTNPAEKNEYVEITEDITVDYIVIRSRTFPNCLTTGTLNTDAILVRNLMVCRGYLIASGAYYGNPNIGYEDGDKNNAIFYDKSTGQAHLNKMPFKDLAGLHNVDNTSDVEKPVSTATQEALDLKADKSNTYTKSEAERKFAQKSDISNVYKFKGSVNTFDDLSDVYTVKAIGDATDDDGNVVGTYNEETGELDFNHSFTIPADAQKNIYIPCTPVVLKPGHYLPLSEGLGDIDVKSDVYPLVYGVGSEKGYFDIHSYTSGLFELSKEVQIKYICVAFDNYSSEEPFDASITGTGSISKDVVKVIYEENKWDAYDYSAPQNGDVYNVTENDMNYAWTGEKWDSLGGEHKDIEAREEISQINAELNKKADKSDVVSAYRFCGSVETFDDLPVQYQMIPNGVPTHNGQVCGTYDEETHTVTIDETTLVDSFDRIIVPIVPIEVKAGKYFCNRINNFDNAIIGDLDTYACLYNDTYETLTEGTISHIEIFTLGGVFEPVGGSTNNLGVLPTIIDSWIDEDGHVAGNIPAGAYDAGAVYEVKDSGLSYGWTGSTWDALGTSHIDSEARADIEQLELQVGDIETALDSIIEIQNGLIGGDNV